MEDEIPQSLRRLFPSGALGDQQRARERLMLESATQQYHARLTVNAGRKVQRGAGGPGGRKVQRTTVQRYRSGESRRSRDFPLPRARHEECMQQWRCGRRSVAGC